jgi:hypothetical protein
MIDELYEVNKMLRKVKSWSKGKRVMVNVNTSSMPKNALNNKYEAKSIWGKPGNPHSSVRQKPT